MKNCNGYSGVKLVGHAIKIFKGVLVRKNRESVNFDAMQFGFISGRGTTDALFVVRRLQQEYARYVQ